MLHSQVDATALLGKAQSATRRDSELVPLLFRRQWKKQGGIPRADAERSAVRPPHIRHVLGPQRHLEGILRAGTALLEQIAVGTRPGTEQCLSREVQPRPRLP